MSTTSGNKPKILVFIDWYLPGFRAGGPIRSCANLVAHLGKDFEFFIVTRDTDYMEGKPYEGITSDAWNRLPDGTQVYYFSEANLKAGKIRELINEQNYDYYYINGIYSLKFSVMPLYLARKSGFKDRIVVAARGMLAQSAIDVKKLKKTVFLKTIKGFGFYRGITFHATNDIEAGDIRRVVGAGAKVKVAPNLPKLYPDANFSPREKKAGSLRMVNVARVAPEKNLLYALEVLVQCKSDISLDFFGPIYNESYWEKCQEVIAASPGNITLNYCGSIDNDKLETLLLDYHFMFMPSRGENFGHIIQEALVAGTPVIISDQTPWKDLEQKQVGWDLPLGDQNKYVEVIDKMAASEFGRVQSFGKKSLSIWP